jgi:hypothetical protein
MTKRVPAIQRIRAIEIMARMIRNVFIVLWYRDMEE